MALLFSNTVDEVVVWLTETTGEPWTMRRLLDVARIFHLNLFVIPPFGARFGWYKWNPENAPSRSSPFVRQMGEPRPRITLPPVCIGDLMEYGHTRMSIVVWPDSEYGMPGHYVIFEPLDSELTVTLDMVRIGENTAHALAAHCTGRDTSAATPAEEPPAEAELGALAADPLNAPLAVAEPAAETNKPNIFATNNGADDTSKSFNKPPAKDPAERRRQLRARRDELKANGEKQFIKILADEEGVSPSRIKQLLSEKRPNRKAANPFPTIVQSGKRSSR